MKKLDMLTILDIGIHALLVSLVILMLRKIAAHGLQLDQWEYGVSVAVSVFFMLLVATIQLVKARRET